MCESYLAAQKVSAAARRIIERVWYPLKFTHRVYLIQTIIQRTKFRDAKVGERRGAPYRIIMSINSPKVLS